MSTVKPINTQGEQLAAAQSQSPRKKWKLKRRDYVLIGILAFVVLAGVVPLLLAFHTYSDLYHKDLSQAQEGVQDLHQAEALLATYPKNYLDAGPIEQARQEFTGASLAFTQINADLHSLPGFSTSVPVYGSEVSAVTQLVPIALEVSQAGSLSCSALQAIIGQLHTLARGQALTTANFSSIEQSFLQIKGAFDQIVGQLNRLPPSTLKVDPRLTTLMNTFHKELPGMQSLLNTASALLPVVPELLGLGTPANYLVEVLDSTELRPGGGFIGNYGIATFSGARLQTAAITDTYLLDKPFVAAGHSIAFPAAYSWFPLSPEGWSLRDSNLDADFPTAATYAEKIYQEESGKNTSLQGVIAITPALIQHLLEITGPISVPEYHQTVTYRNLISLIHHYELDVNDNAPGLTPAPDGYSSVQKNFTALLAKHFLDRVRQLVPSDFSRFIQLFVNGMRSKDIQIYLNSAPAENFLHQVRLDGAIQAPDSDSLFVVDANVAADKANALITDTLNDQVTIDANGNATHQTTLTYAWTTQGNVYGSSLYQDYLRVYVPPGSILHVQNGWQPRGTSTAFGHEVWAGSFTLVYGQTRTITFTWTVPGAAKKTSQGWQYQDLVQRQAGTLWNLHLQVTLPSCATKVDMQGGLVPSISSGQVAILSSDLGENTNVGITYTC